MEHTVLAVAYDKDNRQYIVVEEDWVEAMAPINVTRDAPTRVRALGEEGWQLVSAYSAPYVGSFYFPSPPPPNSTKPASVHMMHFQRASKMTESAK